MRRWVIVMCVTSLSACGNGTGSSQDPSTDPSTPSPTASMPATTTPTTNPSVQPGGSSSAPVVAPSVSPTSPSVDGTASSETITGETTSGEVTSGGVASTSDGSETAGAESTEPATTEPGPSSNPVNPAPSERCSNGPLSEPLPNCAPTLEETGDYHADCVARINQLRWECQCLPPLERFEDGESCANQQSQYDYQVDEAHAGITAKICEPGGSAQNECPGYGGRFGVVDFCLQQMWDEGPGEDFQAHGHYINMSNKNFTRVSCGIYTNEEGEIWAVQNFFR